MFSSRTKKDFRAPSPQPSISASVSASSSSQSALAVQPPILPTSVCSADNAGLALQIRDKLNQVVFPNLILGHFSLYAPPDEATYANDMFARFMKAPRFTLSHRESSRFKLAPNEVLVGLKASGSEKISNTSWGQKCNGYHSPHSSPETGTPWFPIVELQRPVMGLPGVDFQHFNQPLIEKAPMKDMCDLMVDENDEIRFHLHTSKIIEHARQLLKTSAVPESEKQESPAKEKATMVLSCAKAIYHSLSLPGINVDIKGFREDLCRQSISLNFDLNSKRANILMQILTNDSTSRTLVPVNFILASTLIREWMLVAITIAQTIIDPNMVISEIEMAPAYEESASSADPQGMMFTGETDTLPPFEPLASSQTLAGQTLVEGVAPLS